jgi:hypothetical protein
MCEPAVYESILTNDKLFLLNSGSNGHWLTWAALDQNYAHVANTAIGFANEPVSAS